MRRERSPCLVVHQLLGISVIGTDEHNAVSFFDSFHCTTDTLVNRLHRLDRCLFHAGMTYHVRIRKVDDDNIILIGFDTIHQSVTDFVSTHLRFQIISRHILGRIYQDSLFSLVRFFHTAIKEESHMGILLCLGQPCLLHAVCRKPLTECVCNGNLVERHFFIGNRRIII